jgi:hypothetical protein
MNRSPRRGFTFGYKASTPTHGVLNCKSHKFASIDLNYARASLPGRIPGEKRSVGRFGRETSDGRGKTAFGIPFATSSPQQGGAQKMIMMTSNLTESGRVAFVRTIRGQVETAYVRPQYGMKIRRQRDARLWKVVGVDLPSGEMTLVHADEPAAETPIARTVAIGPHWLAEELTPGG